MTSVFDGFNATNKRRFRVAVMLGAVVVLFIAALLPQIRRANAANAEELYMQYVALFDINIYTSRDEKQVLGKLSKGDSVTLGVLNDGYFPVKNGGFIRENEVFRERASVYVDYVSAKPKMAIFKKAVLYKDFERTEAAITLRNREKFFYIRDIGDVCEVLYNGEVYYIERSNVSFSLSTEEVVFISNLAALLVFGAVFSVFIKPLKPQ
ncbi:MAG: hypothetical protein LBN25_00310 [Christensenellaceae bacterium]|jgi:hypothetical protein|nr:hypothetical protein [Christensenellaceae bacterium]